MPKMFAPGKQDVLTEGDIKICNKWVGSKVEWPDSRHYFMLTIWHEDRYVCQTVLEHCAV